MQFPKFCVDSLRVGQILFFASLVFHTQLYEGGQFLLGALGKGREYLVETNKEHRRDYLKPSGRPELKPGLMTEWKVGEAGGKCFCQGHRSHAILVIGIAICAMCAMHTLTFGSSSLSCSWACGIFLFFSLARVGGGGLDCPSSSKFKNPAAQPETRAAPEAGQNCYISSQPTKLPHHYKNGSIKSLFFVCLCAAVIFEKTSKLLLFFVTSTM